MNPDVDPYASLIEIGRRIQQRQITSLAVTEAMLARIEPLQPRLHAYATVAGESARQAAAQADEEIAAGRIRGPLHGVPIAVKDLADTAGIPTAGGMPLNRDRIPAQDATVIARFKAAGAVLLGKLQMTEGAFSGHHPDIDAPVNPWHEALWPGVSSSGSGVATAAGLCYGSIGSDTLGSIRFPCTMNGVTGLKPTWGRVSRAGVLPLAESMDHVGPMARSAADAAALLAAIAGADPADPTAAREPVPDYLRALQAGVGGLRIGVDRAAIGQHAEAAVGQVCDAAAAVFASLGVEIVPLQLPDMTQMAEDALQHCVAECALAHERTYPSQRDAYGPVLSSLIEAGLKVDARSLLRIENRRAEFTGRVQALFGQVDLLLIPAMNRAAPTLADLAAQTTDLAARMARLYFTAPFDMSRSPTLTLPGGQTAAGSPIGFQLVGGHFDEARLLAAGHAFQQSTDWHLRRPAGI
ncbi:MAG: amidase [Burkholderiaceae bacterium]